MPGICAFIFLSCDARILSNFNLASLCLAISASLSLASVSFSRFFCIILNRASVITCEPRPLSEPLARAPLLIPLRILYRTWESDS